MQFNLIAILHQTEPNLEILGDLYAWTHARNQILIPQYEELSLKQIVRMYAAMQLNIIGILHWTEPNLEIWRDL